MDTRPLLHTLPSGGGSAALFAGWADALRDRVEVVPIELPGRGARFAERPPEQLAGYVDALVRDHTPPPGRRWAVLGHSFGALLGAAWAARAHAAGRGPALLVVSGAAPPWLHSTAAALDLPEDELWPAIHRLGGLPAGVLASPAARLLLGRALTADIRAAARHRPDGPVPVGCPVLAVQGAEDPLVTTALGLRWAEIADGRFTHHELPGGHFYRTGLDDLLPLLAETFAPSAVR
ncbi:thioesterase [Kitasatospora sp. NE20-6]|uniref:thioesterase II family protein n=1 Tax=Kitasatospora sp. NE20-6 TaxID=2859066 RepID=UPI0034DCA500